MTGQREPGEPRGGVLRRLAHDTDPQETAEWLESLEYVVRTGGCQRAIYLLERLKEQAVRCGVRFLT
jgi:pyruvate dehydrogenase E1 component